QVPDVDVLGPVVAADAPEHDREVMVEGAAGEHAAHRRLPRVSVGVDESGDDDRPGGVDHLGPAGFEVASDGCDLAVLDKNVAGRDLADLRVEGEHETAPDDGALTHA